MTHESDRVTVTFGGGTCDGDLDGSGDVGPADLATILGAWGANPGSPADLDGDGVVGAADLAMLLGGWGGDVSSRSTPRPLDHQLQFRRPPVMLRTLLPVLLTPAAALAADVQSTRQVGVPTEWSNISRWTNDPAVSTFPDNGNEGLTFDVIIPGTTVSLDVGPTIDSLNIMGVVEHNGQLLDVNGPILASLATFKGGTLSASSLTASSGLTLDNMQATANILTLNGFAGLSLSNGSQLALAGLGGDHIVILGDGDITQPSGGSSILFPDEGTIRKIGGNSASDIRVPIIADSVRIVNNNGLVRFDIDAQSWQNVELELGANTTIDFSSPLTVGDIMISGLTDSPAQVLLRNVIEADGTIASMLGPGLLTVELGGSGATTGRLWRGTIDVGLNGTFVMTGAAEMSEFGLVTNQGDFEWRQGRIMSGGLMNTGLLSTAVGLQRRLDGATLTNTGEVGLDHPIELTPGARIEHQDGVWNTSSNLNVADGGDASTNAFVATAPILVGGNSVYNIPVEISGATITLGPNADLITNHATVLRDCEIIGENGSSVVLTPNGAPDGAELRLEGLIMLESATPLASSELVIAGGRYVLDGTLGRKLDSGGAAEMIGAAELDGGELSFPSDSSPFGGFIQQDSSVLADTMAVTNVGNHEMQGGTIGSGGVNNFGNLVIQPSDPVTINRLDNKLGAEVFHVFGAARLAGEGVINSGRWTAVGASSEINYLTPGSTFPFTNLGEFLSREGGAPTVNVVFDNQGIVTANDTTITFANNVLQFDETTRTLTGGMWRVIDNGVISIQAGGQVFEIDAIGPDASVFVNAATNPTMLTALASIEQLLGLLSLTSAILDFSGNDNDGLVIIPDGGFVGDDEAILGPMTPPSRIIADVFVNRGRISMSNGSVVQANEVLDLADGGVLTGAFGIVESPITNNTSGRVEPGGDDEPAAFSIMGDYTQSTDGVLQIEIAGPSNADALSVTGAAMVGGTLEIVLLDGYQPETGDSFDILTAGSVSGAFDTIMSEAKVEVTYEADRVTVTFGGGTCEGDLDGSGDVGPADLATILGAWGANPGSPADLDGDGVVGAADLAMLLGAWGGCE